MPPNLPDGKAYYNAQIKRYTTLDHDPEEIHAFGLAEVAKIHQEMLDTIVEAKFQGDFPAFLKFLRTDPQFYPKTKEELLGAVSYMMKEFDDKADRYFGYEPRGRFGIHPIPDEVAPYQPAGFGGPGGFMINLYDLPSRPLYAMPALTLHEAAPGHSWAGLIAREHLDPDGFRGGGSAFGEGWALYCERLGTEMDMYHTPYEKFGMLSFQSWRASRLVVDTGMHSMGWTREQASSTSATTPSSPSTTSKKNRPLHLMARPGPQLLPRHDRDHEGAPSRSGGSKVQVQPPRLS